MSERRAFLKGLTLLPLLGGAVTLVGKPTAADVPVTRQLLERYIAWLANEHAAAVFEYQPPNARYDDFDLQMCDWAYARARQALHWFPQHPDIERAIAWSIPSSRAAVIMSAAGIDLVGGDAADG